MHSYFPVLRVKKYLVYTLDIIFGGGGEAIFKPSPVLNWHEDVEQERDCFESAAREERKYEGELSHPQKNWPQTRNCFEQPPQALRF